MAEVTERRDDLDGSPASEQVVFGWGGRTYLIDLNDANAEHFREVMRPWVEHARVQGRPHRSRTKPSRERSAAIRLWAQQSGLEVQARGRLSNEVVRRWENRLSGPADT